MRTVAKNPLSLRPEGFYSYAFIALRAAGKFISFFNQSYIGFRSRGQVSLLLQLAAKEEQ